MLPKYITLNCIVLLVILRDPQQSQYKPEKRGGHWGSLDIQNVLSHKFQGNVLCFVKIAWILDEINKSQFGVYNFTRLITYILCTLNNDDPLH